MKNRTKVIIASGLLLAAAIPVTVLVRRAPVVKHLPVPAPAVVDVKPTIAETTPATEEFNTPVQIPETEPVKLKLENLIETQETEQKDETKKTTKKKTKKTTKKTKKTKKNNKKSDKKSNKETTTPKFTYGTSTYTAKNFNITVHIKKDNSVQVTVVNDIPNKSDKTYYIIEFSGKINPDTGLFTYSNGSKRCVVDTHIRQVRTMYNNNGSGYMTFNGNNLTWFDGVEGHANSVTFHKQ